MDIGHWTWTQISMNIIFYYSMKSIDSKAFPIKEALGTRIRIQIQQ